MGKSSQRKGKRGEDLHAAYLTEKGFYALRGHGKDQFCPMLEHIHFEIKNVQALNFHEAHRQALVDSRGVKTAIVANKRSREPWKYLMLADDFWNEQKRAYDQGYAAGMEAARREGAA